MNLASYFKIKICLLFQRIKVRLDIAAFEFAWSNLIRREHTRTDLRFEAKRPERKKWNWNAVGLDLEDINRFRVLRDARENWVSRKAQETTYLHLLFFIDSEGTGRGHPFLDQQFYGSGSRELLFFV